MRGNAAEEDEEEEEEEVRAISISTLPHRNFARRAERLRGLEEEGGGGQSLK